jgi:hypothetical protein
MLLDQGRVVEFDRCVKHKTLKANLIVVRPDVLLKSPSSKFFALCKATGEEEFATLKKMAGPNKV